MLRHGDVNVVVPGNETLMSHRAQKRAPEKPVGKAVLPCKRVELLEKPQIYLAPLVLGDERLALVVCFRLHIRYPRIRPGFAQPPYAQSGLTQRSSVHHT